jgi:hypothetical protein
MTKWNFLRRIISPKGFGFKDALWSPTHSTCHFRGFILRQRCVESVHNCSSYTPPPASEISFDLRTFYVGTDDQTQNL